ncbi:hypothetical protein [Novosphingobium sp. 9U]|uniref:hypothetical protein n=1 Tax=Novosphingobium sp. 9U TaxID=2653158 RepID=UPI0012F3C18A|nr:hypothetical protein [Novosphingobium sp. 9U]VWX47354.1 conserved membrane hypothetical protein [Novosphingobium sp. 9U]
MRIELSGRDRERSAVGVLALVASLACAFLSARGALTGWLAAAVAFQSLPLTGLFLLAMMRLIRGEWEPMLRPVCEAAARLWPFAAASFVPVLLGLEAIYDWEREAPLSAFQGAWLGYVQYGVRTTIRFIAFALIARYQVGRQASQAASVAALILLLMGTSLTSVDWLMSLDPRFHSSGFGLQMLSIEIAAGFTVLLIVRLLTAPEPQELGLLGGLLLTLLLLWAYFQFMPYLILWSGNLPEGVKWYAVRSHGGWTAATVALGACGLGPILALLLPQVRKRRVPLITVSLIALAGKLIEFAWFALPERGAVAVFAYVLALLGFTCLTGVWFARVRQA